MLWLRRKMTMKRFEKIRAGTKVGPLCNSCLLYTQLNKMAPKVMTTQAIPAPSQGVRTHSRLIISKGNCCGTSGITYPQRQGRKTKRLMKGNTNRR
jgi:hypothetical protein